MTPEQRDRENTLQQFTEFLADEQGQDIAEYAVLLAVILVLVVGTIRLIGSNANTVFSNRQFNSITVKVLTQPPKTRPSRM